MQVRHTRRLERLGAAAKLRVQRARLRTPPAARLGARQGKLQQTKQSGIKKVTSPLSLLDFRALVLVLEAKGLVLGLLHGERGREGRAVSRLGWLDSWTAPPQAAAAIQPFGMLCATWLCHAGQAPAGRAVRWPCLLRARRRRWSRAQCWTAYSGGSSYDCRKAPHLLLCRHLCLVRPTLGTSSRWHGAAAGSGARLRVSERAMRGGCRCEQAVKTLAPPHWRHQARERPHWNVLAAGGRSRRPPARAAASTAHRRLLRSHGCRYLGGPSPAPLPSERSCAQ
jgi:hypothetical protein